MQKDLQTGSETKATPTLSDRLKEAQRLQKLVRYQDPHHPNSNGIMVVIQEVTDVPEINLLSCVVHPKDNPNTLTTVTKPEVSLSGLPARILVDPQSQQSISA